MSLVKEIRGPAEAFANNAQISESNVKGESAGPGPEEAAVTSVRQGVQDVRAGSEGEILAACRCCNDWPGERDLGVPAELLQSDGNIFIRLTR